MPNSILIVDDDDALRQFLGDLLIEEGYKVTLVSGGAAALESIHTEPPALILLDMRMPEMDGWEFLRIYCAMPSPRAPVIAVSAKSLDMSTLICADGFLAKPLDLPTLMQTVQRFVSANAG